MRRAVLVSFGLLGIAKGIALVAAPELMVQLTPLTEPAARLALCLFATASGGLLFFAAPAARAPRLIRQLGLFGMVFGLASAMLPSAAWEAYAELVHALMLHHSAMGASISIAVALVLLWAGGSRTPQSVESVPAS